MSHVTSYLCLFTFRTKLSARLDKPVIDDACVWSFHAP